MVYIRENKTYIFKETIKKSIFITVIRIIKSEEEFTDFIKKYSDKKATHNVHAFRFIEEKNIKEGFKDDKEPSKSAAFPILSILRVKDIINIGVLVKRYYGGIKLGVGGLTRAYTSGLKKLLNTEIELENPEEKTIKIRVSAKDYENVIKFLSKLNFKILLKEEKSNIFVFKLSYVNLDNLNQLRNYKGIMIL